MCKLYDNSHKDIISFSGKNDIFSNFNPRNTNVFGMSHASAEHAFQYSKAMRSGDVVNVSAVRNASTVLDAKHIRAEVTSPNERLIERDDVMKEILEAKFEPVIEFKDSVLHSSDSILFVEAVHDDDWGSGLDNHTSKSSVTS